MQFPDLRARLGHEYERLRTVSTDLGGDLTAPVPSCPAWSVDDLLRHLAGVYRHTVAAIRDGEPAADRTPDTSAEPALDLLARAYRELAAEFEAHDPADPAWTWFAPDRTVGFWIRRMAHETAIHRYDAELAADTTTPVVSDLALDGIDEALTVILPTDGDLTGLSPVDLPTIEVRSGRSYFVRPTLAGVLVDGTDENGEAATTIEGVPSDLVLWLWRRADAANFKVTGDPSGVAVLARLMETATR